MRMENYLELKGDNAINELKGSMHYIHMNTQQVNDYRRNYIFTFRKALNTLIINDLIESLSCKLEIYQGWYTDLIVNKKELENIL